MKEKIADSLVDINMALLELFDHLPDSIKFTMKKGDKVALRDSDLGEYIFYSSNRVDTYKISDFLLRVYLYEDINKVESQLNNNNMSKIKTESEVTNSVSFARYIEDKWDRQMSEEDGFVDAGGLFSEVLDHLYRIESDTGWKHVDATDNLPTHMVIVWSVKQIRPFFGTLYRKNGEVYAMVENDYFAGIDDFKVEYFKYLPDNPYKKY